MKYKKIPIFSSIILFIINNELCSAQKDNNDRQGKILNYRYSSGVEGLNFDRIISLWNRSASVSEEPPISQRWSMPSDRQERPSSKMPEITTKSPPPTTERMDRVTYADSFPERFKNCVTQQQKKLVEGSQHGQNIIIKCFKTELITKLHRLLSNSDPSIKLFNGYLEFEKIRKESSSANSTRKRYSSRVATATSKAQSENLIPVPLKRTKNAQNPRNEYYENYQKMLRELVARKSGAERIRREAAANETEAANNETLQKTAKLLENGRKLISEITNNLENEEEEVENLTETIMDPELVSTLNTFSRNYALKLNFYPGISARMKRNQNNGVTFDLELDELSGDDDDDDDDEDNDAGRDDIKKKKKKKIKISKKVLKKLFPYLLIPFMIQAALLPFVLKFLLFIAIKALLAGKLALILVAFNLLKNASHKSDEDEYAERMAVEHYGYGNGEEYGAWVNRRTFVLPEDDEGRKLEENNPYRAHDPKREDKQ